MTQPAPVRFGPDQSPLPPAWRGAALALGNFDGVHLGHQAVVAAAAAAAEALGAPLAAAVFEPHPRVFFQPGAAPFRLQSGAQRARALGALGVGAVVEIGFDAALAALDDEAFARARLVEALGVAHVAVGFDFTFGRGRMGDVVRLRALGGALGFGVSVAPELTREGRKVSSTAIRALLEAGDPAAAAALLTRPFAVEGVVVGGFQRGRTIGVPTANQALADYVRPRFGVYAATADLGDGRARPAVANLGVKPTVGGAEEPLLETHVFDFEGDLYGREIEVALRAFLRPERKFPDFAALTAQISADAAQARALLGA